MKKIMILSSNYTGHGHASIAQSITEQLDQYDDVRYQVVDGFELIGKAGIRMSKLYGPITRKAQDLWRISFALFDQHPRALIEPITWPYTISSSRPRTPIYARPYPHGCNPFSTAA